MKKIYITSAILLFFLNSCSDPSDNEAKSKNDSTGLTNPIVMDTVKHPGGMDNSSVISTDTAAINVQNSMKKADSAKKEKGEQ